MSDIWPFLNHLRDSLAEERQKLDRLQRMQEQLDRDPVFSEHLRGEVQRVREEIEVLRSGMETLTKLFLRVPPWHARHRAALSGFTRALNMNPPSSS